MALTAPPQVDGLSLRHRYHQIPHPGAGTLREALRLLRQFHKGLVHRVLRVLAVFEDLIGYLIHQPPVCEIHLLEPGPVRGRLDGLQIDQQLPSPPVPLFL